MDRPPLDGKRVALHGPLGVNAFGESIRETAQPGFSEVQTFWLAAWTTDSVQQQLAVLLQDLPTFP